MVNLSQPIMTHSEFVVKHVTIVTRETLGLITARPGPRTSVACIIRDSDILTGGRLVVWAPRGVGGGVHNIMDTCDIVICA